MLRTRFLFSGLSLILALAALVNAEDEGGCARRKVLVNVLDRDGNAIATSEGSIFQAKLHGKRLNVLSVTHRSTAPRIVIMLDLSESLHRSSAVARALAGNLVISAGSGGPHPALILFSDRIIDSVDFSHPAADLTRKLDNLPDAKGHTALFDALKYAAELFGRPLLGDSIYLISDGGNNVGSANESEIQTELVAKQIRVFSVGISEHYFPTDEERLGPDVLVRLAEITGGATLAPDIESSEKSRERARSAVQRLYRQMADFEELEIEVPSDSLRKQQRWMLEIVDEKGKRRKDVRLVYPHELAPCGQLSAVK